MDDPIGARLAASRAAYAGLRGPIEAGEPWPLATAFGTEPEADWGPREVLTHVAEMLPFWLGEWERVQAGDGAAPVRFGRIADDALRIGVIERDRSLPLRELFARIDTGIGRWADRLADAARDPGWTGRVGVHPRLGELEADALVERFVVSHLEDHVAQLRTVLDRGS
jgi:hypothetical protein